MHMFRAILIGGCAALIALPSSVALAAEAAKAEEQKPVAQTEAKPTEAPFMKPLGRLASILGSVHFLRQLCGDDNAVVWRERMDELLRVQSPNPADKALLIASFNSGYRAYASVYRRCTPAARVAVARHQEEGSSLSRDIAARYGN